MKVRDLITALLDADMDDEIEILMSKGRSLQIFRVHPGTSASQMNTGVLVTAIEPIDDLKRLDE